LQFTCFAELTEKSPQGDVEPKEGKSCGKKKKDGSEVSRPLHFGKEKTGGISINKKNASGETPEGEIMPTHKKGVPSSTGQEKAKEGETAGRPQICLVFEG